MIDFSGYFIFAVIAIGIVCGAFCAAIATAKGRKAFPWFIGGLLINLAGILFALLVEPNYDKMVRNRQRKRCPFCAEVINVEAVKCPHCTADLPDTVDLQDSRTSEKEQNTALKELMKPCPLCAEPIKAEFTFCPHCWRDLPTEEQKEE